MKKTLDYKKIRFWGGWVIAILIGFYTLLNWYGDRAVENNTKQVQVDNLEQSIKNIPSVVQKVLDSNMRVHTTEVVSIIDSSLKVQDKKFERKINKYCKSSDENFKVIIDNMAIGKKETDTDMQLKKLLRLSIIKNSENSLDDEDEECKKTEIDNTYTSSNRGGMMYHEDKYNNFIIEKSTYITPIIEAKKDTIIEKEKWNLLKKI